jgi:hypothetical protein
MPVRASKKLGRNEKDYPNLTHERSTIFGAAKPRTNTAILNSSLLILHSPGCIAKSTTLKRSALELVRHVIE